MGGDRQAGGEESPALVVINGRGKLRILPMATKQQLIPPSYIVLPTVVYCSPTVA